MTTTKEDMEDVSGSEVEQECWFGEGGCMNQVRWRVRIGEIAVRER